MSGRVDRVKVGAFWVRVPRWFPRVRSTTWNPVRPIPLIVRSTVRDVLGPVSEGSET